MTSVYYFAAHFPPTHKYSIQHPATEFTHPPLDLQSEQTPPTAPARIQRVDSLLSPPPTQRRPATDPITYEQQTSIFFRLPAELRNQIYNELLCSGTYSLSELSKHTVQRASTAPVYPNILSTCRKIHAEAGDLLYAPHIFHAHLSLLTALPHRTPDSRPVLDARMLAKITRWRLTLRLDTDPRFTAAQAARAFSGADYLEIRVWQSMFDGCNAAVLKLFLGVRAVKVVRVLGSVEDELARWLEKRMMMPRESGDICECAEEREIRCGSCCRRVETGDWFEERDAWRFGNR
jgi:hypothetical protein